MQAIMECKDLFDPEEIADFCKSDIFYFKGKQHTESMHDWPLNIKVKTKGKSIDNVKGKVNLAVISYHVELDDDMALINIGEIAWVDIYTNSNKYTLWYRAYR